MNMKDNVIYKTNKPFIIEYNGKKKVFAKNQVIVSIGPKKYLAQGRRQSFNNSLIKKMIKMGVIDKIFNLTEEYIKENVIGCEEYYKVIKIHSEANKELKKYCKVLNTLSTWVFLAKGSNAITVEQEIKFQENPKIILDKTILRNGIKSKPGQDVMNRGLYRNGPFVDVDSGWESDETTLLPYGIRKSDYATMSEQIKIYKKLVSQIVSMEDCPDEFRLFFEEKLNIVKSDEPFRDYLPLIDSNTRENLGCPKLYFSDFDKNGHHSKEKGLELCHIDPFVEFTTNVENVTIGSSRANRLQGGYPIWLKREMFK